MRAMYVGLGIAAALALALLAVLNRFTAIPAADAMGTVAAKHANSQYVAQALYYQGEALYAVDKKAEACAAYESRMLLLRDPHATQAEILDLVARSGPRPPGIGTQAWLAQRKLDTPGRLSRLQYQVARRRPA